MYTQRPQFNDVNFYISHLSACLDAGAEPWPPGTVPELQAALDHFPSYAARWMPSKYVIDRTPSLACFRNPWQVRFLDALHRDDRFRSDVARQLEAPLR